MPSSALGFCCDEDCRAISGLFPHLIRWKIVAINRLRRGDLLKGLDYFTHHKLNKCFIIIIQGKEHASSFFFFKYFPSGFFLPQGGSFKSRSFKWPAFFSHFILLKVHRRPGSRELHRAQWLHRAIKPAILNLSAPQLASSSCILMPLGGKNSGW